MAVKIGDKVFRNEQEQVQKNMKDIEFLKQYIKEAYKCSSELTSATDQVLKSSTNAGEDVTSGWLMDSIGNLFTITGGDDTYLLLDFFTSLRGPEGEDGAAGYSIHYSVQDYDSQEEEYNLSQLQPSMPIYTNDIVMFKNGYVCRIYNVSSPKYYVTNAIQLQLDINETTPVLELTAEQTPTLNVVTLTLEQYNIIANNEYFIFKDNYHYNVEFLMKKLTTNVFGNPQTDFVCQCVYTYHGSDATIETFQLRVTKNTLACYIENISNKIPTEAYSTYVIGNLTPTEDNGDYYFNMSDIEIDDLKEYDLLMTTDVSDNASKLYQVDYIDTEEEKIWVLDVASFGGGSQAYLHNILLSNNTSPLFAYYSCVVKADTNTAVTSLSDLATLLYNNGYVSASKIAVLSGMCRNTSTNKTFIGVGVYSPDGTSVKTIVGDSVSTSFYTNDTLSGYNVEDFVK